MQKNVTLFKKDVYRRKGKCRRCCLGDIIYSIPCRFSYFSPGWYEEKDEFIIFFCINPSSLGSTVHLYIYYIGDHVSWRARRTFAFYLIEDLYYILYSVHVTVQDSANIPRYAGNCGHNQIQAKNSVVGGLLFLQYINQRTMKSFNC